jgi:UDP-N-acetylglucosamine acyltransferase
MSSITPATDSSIPGIHREASIHPAAFVDPSATIAAGAIIEAGAVVGPRVTIGPGTRLRHYAVVVQDTVIGAHNDIHPHAVLGGDPQDFKYKPETPGTLIIGDHNIIREHATLHRSVEPGPPTTIGNHNYIMAGAHAGHNARVGNNNTLANGTMLAGHAHVGNRCVFGGGATVHQFCTVGDGNMFRGLTGVGMHTPPFVIIGEHNTIIGLNAVGMRRNPALDATDREHIKRAFRAVFRDRGARPIRETIEQELRSDDWTDAARLFRRFTLDRLNDPAPRARGVVGVRRRSTNHEEPGEA